MTSEVFHEFDSNYTYVPSTLFAHDVSVSLVMWYNQYYWIEKIHECESHVELIK